MAKREPRYDILATYKGYDHSIDDALERVARVESVGGGYCFFSGERDQQFVADRKQTAINVQKRLRAQLKKLRVRGRVEVYDRRREELKPVRLY